MPLRHCTAEKNRSCIPPCRGFVLVSEVKTEHFSLYHRSGQKGRGERSSSRVLLRRRRCAAHLIQRWLVAGRAACHQPSLNQVSRAAASSQERDVAFAT